MSSSNEKSYHHLVDKDLVLAMTNGLLSLSQGVSSQNSGSDYRAKPQDSQTPTTPTFLPREQHPRTEAYDGQSVNLGNDVLDLKLPHIVSS